jgi:hypothetical protein
MSLKGRSCGVVNIRMDEAEKLSLESIGLFVAASEEIGSEAEDRQQRSSWVEGVRAAVRSAGQGCAGPAAALHREDDRSEPGAGHATDRSLHGQRANPGDGLSATAFLATLHTSRHRTAGLGRRSARDAERAGDAAHPGTGTPALEAPGVCASGRYLGGASVQPVQEPALPRAAVELHQDAAHGGVDWRAAQAPSRRASPAICVWTRCIRAMVPRTRAFIKSMPSTRPCNGRSSARRRASRHLSGHRCRDRNLLGNKSLFERAIGATARKQKKVFPPRQKPDPAANRHGSASAG